MKISLKKMLQEIKKGWHCKWKKDRFKDEFEDWVEDV